MGFYSRRIFPYLMDWSMASPHFAKYRQETLSHVKGEVLEIGFGTGLNLSYYPATLHQLATVDVNPAIHQLAQKRLRNSAIVVKHHVISGENLPMAANTFDSVVSTFTLCSIAKVEQAIEEIHRVLRPGGQFFFAEHGLSNDPKIQAWQQRLTPLQRRLGDGCHLDRNIRQLVANQFSTLTVAADYAEGFPKVLAYFYQGVATKAQAQ